jgi:RNA polymerase sigma factor (sigma-70 family)
MKKYNVQNYIRYKNDVKQSVIKVGNKAWDEYTRDGLIIKFLPLVENLARKFSTEHQASGVMSINDLIQMGSLGLIKAVDKLEIERVMSSDDPEKTIKSFLAKRIRGAIRREIDINRGTMRIPEHKLNEIRKDFGSDKRMVSMFFNSIFLSIDDQVGDDEDAMFQIPDTSEPYNLDMMNAYLSNLLYQYLPEKEREVLRLSYGLDCDKHSAKQIADKLGIQGSSSYVRVSQLKRQAIDRLVNSVDHSQVAGFL